MLSAIARLAVICVCVCIPVLSAIARLAVICVCVYSSVECNS